MVLAVDMVHSMCYVAGLYQKRLQEWEQEDHAEACIQLVPVMHHVVKHCHNRDPLLWPPAVTAAVNSTIETIPHLAPLASPQPASGNEDDVTFQAATTIPAGLPRPINVFAHLGLDIGDAELESEVPSALKKLPDSQLGPQPDLPSKQATASPVTCAWAKILSLLSPQWQLPLMPSYLASRWQASDSSQVNVGNSTAAAPEARNLRSSDASHANPQICSNANAPTHVANSCSLLHPAQQSCITLADQLAHQAKLQGLPWPVMSWTRRSALRWHVEWHGLQWSSSQDCLELQLDQHY